MAGKQVLTDEEAAKLEATENRRQNRDLIDPEKGGLNYVPGGVIPYNEFWYDRGNKTIGSRRTSLIVDPPDGRIPPRTPEAQKRLDDQAAASREDQLGLPRADNPEDRDVSDLPPQVPVLQLAERIHPRAVEVQVRDQDSAEVCRVRDATARADERLHRGRQRTGTE